MATLEEGTLLLLQVRMWHASFARADGRPYRRSRASVAPNSQRRRMREKKRGKEHRLGASDRRCRRTQRSKEGWRARRVGETNGSVMEKAASAAHLGGVICGEKQHGP
jgi:hypothetical protein